MRIYERLTPLNARERRSAEKHHTLLTTYIKRHNLGVCQVFCVSFLEKILWGGEPPPL